MDYKRLWRRHASKIAAIAAALGLKFFIISTALIVQNAEMRGMVRDLTARQEALSQLVAVVAPLAQMQAMAARFEQADAHGGIWTPAEAGRVTAAIFRCAKKWGLDPLLIEAVIVVESARMNHAVGARGERGLMQPMPDHLAPGQDPHDCVLNVETGTAYLAKCNRRSRGNIRLALSLYNAGVNCDLRKLPAKSIEYAERVMKIWAELRGDHV